MIEFNVGDTVHIGPKRQKGKIVDIVYPVGPQSCIMYKVQLFNEGTIRTVDKVTLVKGLQNDILLPDQAVMLPGPHSAVGNVSGYRCVSDCRSRGREFDPGPVPYFRGD